MILLQRNKTSPTFNPLDLSVFLKKHVFATKSMLKHLQLWVNPVTSQRALIHLSTRGRFQPPRQWTYGVLTNIFLQKAANRGLIIPHPGALKRWLIMLGCCTGDAVGKENLKMAMVTTNQCDKWEKDYVFLSKSCLLFGRTWTTGINTLLKPL